MSTFHLGEQIFQVCADPFGVPFQVLFLYYIKDSQTNCTRHWVPAKLEEIDNCMFLLYKEIHIEVCKVKVSTCMSKILI